METEAAAETGVMAVAAAAVVIADVRAVAETADVERVCSQSILAED